MAGDGRVARKMMGQGIFLCFVYTYLWICIRFHKGREQAQVNRLTFPRCIFRIKEARFSENCNAVIFFLLDVSSSDEVRQASRSRVSRRKAGIHY